MDSRFDCPSDRANNAARFAALPNVDKYPDLVDYFADDLPLAYAKAGKIEKVRSLLADEDDRLVKLSLLGHSAGALAAKADRGSAAKLLDEAAQFVPGDLKTSEEFRAAEVYALGLSRVDPGKAFDMTEKLLDKANRLLNIRSELAGFSSGTEDLTPAMDLRQRQVAVNSSYAIAIIRVLAHADFDRTVKLADRFSEQGQRLFFRWYIVNALLNRHAEEDQQRFASVDSTRLCG